MDIAEAVGVTYPFFIKIAGQLKKAGLIEAVQGRHGGYQLGMPACEISLYNVFLAIEGELQINRCLKGVKECSHITLHGCKLRSFFCRLQEQITASMSGIVISDLIHTSVFATDKTTEELSCAG